MTPTVAAIAAVGGALAYAASCWIWPFRDCARCEGRGHHRPDGNRRLSRPCRRCKGTGKRLRIGRRAWNRARQHSR